MRPSEAAANPFRKNARLVTGSLSSTILHKHQPTRWAPGYVSSRSSIQAEFTTPLRGTAESLYEAAALAVAEFQRHGWLLKSRVRELSKPNG